VCDHFIQGKHIQACWQCSSITICKDTVADFKTHPPKPAEAEPSFRKVSLLPAKLCMLFPAHLWAGEFWPQIYSLSQALDWGLLSKILASTKWAGPSRVPWPENLWMPFTFQPALWALQQPHKHSHSLQLCSYCHWTSTSLHSIGFINSQLFSCKVFKRFFKVPHSHIRALPSHLKGPLATSKWHTLLVYSGCHHGKM